MPVTINNWSDWCTRQKAGEPDWINRIYYGANYTTPDSESPFFNKFGHSIGTCNEQDFIKSTTEEGTPGSSFVGFTRDETKQQEAEKKRKAKEKMMCDCYTMESAAFSKKYGLDNAMSCKLIWYPGRKVEEAVKPVVDGVVDFGKGIGKSKGACLLGGVSGCIDEGRPDDDPLHREWWYGLVGYGELLGAGLLTYISIPIITSTFNSTFNTVLTTAVVGGTGFLVMDGVDNAGFWRWKAQYRTTWKELFKKYVVGGAALALGGAVLVNGLFELPTGMGIAKTVGGGAAAYYGYTNITYKPPPPPSSSTESSSDAAGERSMNSCFK